jgi:hypothetical protein
MSLSVGIVGLPNVGKSTLFKSLTKKKVDCSNYPFCTIDPNVGIVKVPDERLDQLEKFSNSKKKIYASVKFVDIAGLVAGASKGEGLGNKFLANIREVDVILYVLRCFKNEKVTNTQDKIDIFQDKAILDTEMILKDLETVGKRIEALEKESRSGDKEIIKKLKTVKKAEEMLENGKLLNKEEWNEEEKKQLKGYQLLTLKKRLYLLNGGEEEVSDQMINQMKEKDLPFLVVDILTEGEALEMSVEDRKSMGLPEKLKIEELIKRCYSLLGLITFFTTGEDESRAWTIKKGSTAPEAGAAIHSDFEDNFVKAEVINWQELIEAGSIAEARNKGLIRLEGKNYIVQDGDVIEFKSGV